MADTKQNITLNVGAKDDGATATLNKVGQGLDKLQNKAKSASGNQPGGMGGFFKGIKQQAEGSGIAGDTGLVGFLKGAGALEGIRLLGQGLQKIPEIATQYQADKRVGNASLTESVTEGIASAVPVVGDLAKGFRALWDINSKARQEEKDFRRQQIDEADALREKAAARARAGRDSIDASFSAIRAANLNSAPEALRGIQAANNAYADLDAQLKQIRRDAQLAKLPDNALTAMDKSHVAQRRAALDAALAAEKEYNKARVEAYRAGEIELADARAQTQSAYLVNLGREEDAALVIIRRNAAKARDAVSQQFANDQSAGRNPSSQQYQERLRAINAQAVQEERRIEDQRRERAKARETAYWDIVGGARSAGLRLVGRDTEAQLLDLERETQRAIEAVRADKTNQNQARDIQALRGAAGISRAGILESDRISKDQRSLDILGQGVALAREAQDLGLSGNSQEAEKLAILTEQVQRRREILEALKKDNLSASDREGLNAQLGLIDAVTKAKTERIGRGTFSGGLAPSEQSRFLTGVSAIAKENDPFRKPAEKMDKAAETMLTAVGKMLDNAAKIFVFKGFK